MTILSKFLLALGLLLLTHATYSAHEHHTLFTSLPTSPTATTAAATTTTTTLPTDIILETLISALILSIALVLGSAEFQPISWREWAGKIEREGGARNPFLGVERRDGFVDIRARRREFAEWVRGQDTAAKKQ